MGNRESAAKVSDVPCVYCAGRVRIPYFLMSDSVLLTLVFRHLMNAYDYYHRDGG